MLMPDRGVPFRRFLRPAVLAFSALGAALAVGSPVSSQQSTFRSTVDVIAVDVQVVDRTGQPIRRLAADRFDVEINGRRRRVVSVDFIEHARPESGSLTVADAQMPSSAALPPRVYMIGVDVGSLSIVESRAIIEGGRQFINRLRPEDRVGVYAFPIGPRFRPSTDHASIVRRLETIAGSREALHNSHGLSATDVIDIMAEASKADMSPIMRAEPTGRGTQQAQGSNSETLDTIVARECGVEDRPCAQAILAEAQGMSFIFQGQATQALNGLRQLVGALSTTEGPKTLVLLSAGMPVSDRPGGRPDVGELPKLLGQEAAASNTTIYCIFLQSGFAQLVSPKSQHPSPAIGDGREQQVFGRVLEEFTAASGGALLPVAQGTVIDQFERVLRETASRYLLGVEPADADRDGTLRRLTVKVRSLPRGASVRSRMWVVIPRRG